MTQANAACNQESDKPIPEGILKTRKKVQDEMITRKKEQNPEAFIGHKQQRMRCS
jgi:hypothetical protein